MSNAKTPIKDLEPTHVSPTHLKIERKKMFICLFFVILLFCIGYCFYWFFYSSCYISTNNAYVGAEVAEITSLIEGTIEHIYVTDTQHVKEGEILVVIDDRDAKLALKQAEAKLLRVTADMERAELNYQRRKQLGISNLISAEELGDAENTLKAAQATFQEIHSLKEIAELNLVKTTIRAPISGVVAQRQVQLGQRVIAGNKLLSIVPLANMHVSANFKENELRNIQVGQPVILTSDKYGSKIQFHGIVEGFSGGTGSVFAIIPAQNATGNWVKVVQRLPVRIKLDPEKLVKNPLEIGLSMHAKIEISTRR
jgi:membrane fusion protein (multidrug efflux system)